MRCNGVNYELLLSVVNVCEISVTGQCVRGPG